MNYRNNTVCLLIALSTVAASKSSPFSTTKVFVDGGSFQPQFGTDKATPKVKVEPFWIDSHHVTEVQFQSFLKSRPSWIDPRESEGLVDKKLLDYWTSKKSRQLTKKYYPAVYVTWFAAEAYCESKGGRLPSTFEWEYLARASETDKDSGSDPEVLAKILSWYGRPNSDESLFSVFQGRPNAFGAYHLHGLVWEWTSDFNAFFAATDSRQAGDKDNDLLCGVGSIDAADRENYAAFMRFAMRSSLKANDSLSNLGFRCAYDN
jgi:formylglycine-generating enzyme required for sulfatase activity